MLNQLFLRTPDIREIYIYNRNISLGMLNQNKLHLNRFRRIQVVKNYRVKF